MWKVKYKEFKKDPTKALLFLTLGAITYLYFDNKVINNNRIDYLMQENIKKEQKIEKLETQIAALYQKINKIK
jgi:hypothetical protein